MKARIKLVAICTILLMNFACEQEEEKAFSFVQICDPQLGMGGYEHDVRSFTQAVKQINALGPDFVVICGDLVHHSSDSTYADFLNISNEFNIPCYLAPGNHDLGMIPNDSSLNYYRSNLGKDYYMFRNKGFDFIVTNTQLWKSDIGNESVDHDNWFKETLIRKGKRKTPVIVIGHYPLYIEYPGEEEEYFNLPPDKRQELLDMFLQNKVLAYLSGHVHRTVINQYENILLVNGETTSKNFDKRPLGFRLWDVSGDSISHSFHPLNL